MKNISSDTASVPFQTFANHRITDRDASRAIFHIRNFSGPGFSRSSFLLPLAVLLVGSATGALAQPVVEGVVNGASFATPVVAGGTATIFGFNLAGSTASFSGTAPVPLTLAGTGAQIGGFPAPVYSVSSGLVTIQIPWELAGQLQAVLTVTTTAGVSNPVTVSLAPFAPALFSLSGNGLGQGLIFNFDNTLNGLPDPTVPGGTVQILATNLGAVANQPADGAGPSANSPASVITPLSVTIGGLPALVTGAQLCGTPGLLCGTGTNTLIGSTYGVTVQVPQNVTIGPAVPVVLTMGGVSSNTVTMAVAFPPLTSVGILLPAGITVGLGGSAPFPVNLVAPAPPGGVVITLGSSDTSKVTLSFSELFIPAGATTSPVIPKVNGIAFGSSTISASAVGYPTASQTVQAAQTISLSPATLTVTSATTGHLFVFLSAPAPAGGLTINLSSSNTGVATVPQSVIIPASATSASVGVTGVGTGTAVIHANNLPTVADTTANITVVAGTPASVTATSGNPQTAPINTAFAPLVVTVTDGGGNPLSGVPVTFAAPSSGPSGTFTGGTNIAVTNSSGMATVIFTANGLAGPFAVTASVSGVAVPASFSLSNVVAFPTIAATSGGGQSQTVNNAFGSLVVTVKNASGNPVGAGVIVTFSVPLSGAGGTFAGGANTAVTNGSGVATSAVFTANSIAGNYSVSATAPGVLAPAVFPLTNTPGPPFLITATGGTPQSAGLNTPFVSPLVALVKDAAGNPIPNSIVTFTPPASGASGTFAGGVNTAVTSTAGLATSTTFTANGTLGSYMVSAASGSAPPALFALNNTMGLQIPAGVIVGLGATASFAVTLGAPAPPGGLVVTLTSSNPSAVGLNTPNVLIPGGQTASPTTPQVIGAAFGSSTITASAVGYPSTSQTVQTTDTLSFSPNAATIPSATRGILFVFLSAPAPAGGLTLNLTSSNTAVATVPSTVTIAASATSASVAVTGVATGTAVIHASNLPFIADTTANIAVISGTPASITATSGNPQSGPINTTFAPLVVTVKDGGGNPLSGVPVSFAAPASGPSGTFATNPAITNSSGMAAATFTANGLGGPYVVTASVAGIALSANFSLSNVVALPTIAATSGGGQSQAINSAFGPLVATVKNASGNPVGAGVVVTFSAPLSGASGTFAGGANTAVTNGSGVATSAVFTANSVAGNYSVTATAPGVVAPAAFPLTNLAGPAFSVAAVSGTPQMAGMNTVFPSPFVALVKDSGGNPVPSATVTFTAPASGASGTFAGGVNTAVTNAAGLATATPFTANGMPGSYIVTAASGSTPPALFALNNTMGLQIPGGVIVGLGSSTLFPVTLGAPAPPGGVFITLTSSNPGVVGLISPNILIPAGQTAALAQSRVTGVAFGTATITASAVGFPSVSQTVQTADILNFVPNTGTVNSGKATAIFLSLSVPAPPGGVTLNVSSSNPGIATVPSTVFIPANSTSVGVLVTGVSPGAVTIHASDLPIIADTTATVTVN